MSAERLHRELRARAKELRRRRLTLEEVYAAALESLPHLRARPEVREELAELLRALEDQGHLRWPKARAAYDARQLPELPRWVALTRPPRDRTALDRAQEIAWHPALSFVPDLAWLRAEELEELLAIQRFLSGPLGHGPELTVRERSLLLFRDDKRLEGLARGRLFAPGRLGLSILRCREVYPPLAFRDFGSGSSALIIENKDTYASASRARAALDRSEVRFIVFGSGNAIVSSLPALGARLLGEPCALKLVDALARASPEPLDVLALVAHAPESSFDSGLELARRLHLLRPGMGRCVL